jgi:hypothetical protein
MARLYADDAQSTTVDASNQPSRPRIVRGKEEIGALWKDIMSRDVRRAAVRLRR